MFRWEVFHALQTLGVIGRFQACVEIGTVGLIQHRRHIGALIRLGWRSLTAPCLESLLVVELITNVFGHHELGGKAVGAALLKDVEGELLLLQNLVCRPWLACKVGLERRRNSHGSLLFHWQQLICGLLFA